MRRFLKITGQCGLANMSQTGGKSAFFILQYYYFWQQDAVCGLRQNKLQVCIFMGTKGDVKQCNCVVH